MDKGEIVLNIQYQTQLLESLSWDEQLLDQLLTYLDTEFSNFNLKSPSSIIIEVEEHFGKETAKVLSEIFKSQLLFLKAHSGDPNNEH